MLGEAPVRASSWRFRRLDRCRSSRRRSTSRHPVFLGARRAAADHARRWHSARRGPVPRSVGERPRRARAVELRSARAGRRARQLSAAQHRERQSPADRDAPPVASERGEDRRCVRRGGAERARLCLRARRRRRRVLDRGAIPLSEVARSAGPHRGARAPWAFDELETASCVGADLEDPPPSEPSSSSRSCAPRSAHGRER